MKHVLFGCERDSLWGCEGKKTAKSSLGAEVLACVGFS